MKKRLKNLFTHGAMVGLACATILGAGYTFAAPTTAPSAGTGVYLPVDIGPGAQTKAGALTVSGGVTTGTLTASTICLAGDCQSSWPSGSEVQSMVINGAGYTSACSPVSYSLLTYYQYGNGPYTQYTYVCSQQVSVTLANAIPNGTIVLDASNLIVWCHSGAYNYTGYSPPENYINDSYYYNRVAATNVNATASGSNLVVTATCPFFGSYYSYAYSGVAVSGSILAS